MSRSEYWDKMPEEQRNRYRETAKLGMRKLRATRPRLKWAFDTMTYAIVRASAKGAGISPAIIYAAKKNKSCPDPRICAALVEYSGGLLNIDDFRTDVDGNVHEWEAVRVTRGGKA